MPRVPRLSRRTAVGGLVALGGALTAGCTDGDGQRAAGPTGGAGTADPSGSPSGSASPRGTPAPDPDVTLAAALLREEEAVLALLDATVRRHPRLTTGLASARQVHRAHVRLLRRAVPDEAGTSSSPSPATSSPTGTPTGSSADTSAGPRVPTRPGPALAAVVRAEDRLAGSGHRAAIASRSGSFARLLASQAAAAAQQSAVLSGLTGATP